MLHFIIVVLTIALLIYALLGGADFGAGIIETFIGKKGENTISKAIAPVWEANHVWLVLIVVILFNGFPLAYTTISTYLHIPLTMVLTGIILRGSAFSFRYYDVDQKKNRKTYTLLFRMASFLTPLFLGICVGALSTSRIPGGIQNVSFVQGYIIPWLNSYCFTIGIFTIIIFGTVAAIYLMGEANDRDEKLLFMYISKYMLLLLIFTGILVFIFAAWNDILLFGKFLKNRFGIIFLLLSLVTIPWLYYSISKGKVFISRLLIGFQVFLILSGYLVVTFPELVNLQDANPITFYNSAATDKTLKQLGYALIVGILIIIPSFIYLFNIYKFKKSNKEQ